ncbi:MAG: Undecaprenyl-diphosphatase [Chitinophagaceae bacterium]|nr:Undecaprenyl-diphosphatase [Chitinophagaceae bacterium]
MTITQALILAVVEGLTEFLPVSSTGHMIIVSSMMGISSDEFTKIFTVNIQFGTILSVVVLYYKRFFKSIQFYFLLLAAFIPAAILGFLLGDFIDSLLENVVVVACMLILGGVFFLFLDKIFPPKQTIPEGPKGILDSEEAQAITDSDQISSLSYLKSFIIGCFQCLALVPGVSRAAATIVGGLSQGLNKKNAAEFSFFLAVPTMFAASAYKLLKDHAFINQDNISLLLIGNVVGFIVALVAIKGFISFVTQKGFAVFGYYRIALGILVLVLYYLGVNLQVN